MNISIMTYVRASCLAGALMIQPLSAGPIALGPDYSTFDNLIIVGLGTTDIENCDHLLSAIANTSGTRTIKLPPASYDCTTDTVNVPDNVTIEGSGQENTFIKGVPSTFNTIDLNNGSELRYLTVENNLTSSTLVTAIRIVGAGNRLTHVTAVSEGNNNNENAGVLLDTGSTNFTLNDVTIRVDNALNFNEGILTESPAGATLNNVNILALDTAGTATSSGILNNTGSGSTTIRNSVINGASEAINIAGGSPTYNITHTQLLNGVTPGAGTLNCFGAFNETLSALTAGCVLPPPM